MNLVDDNSVEHLHGEGPLVVDLRAEAAASDDNNVVSTFYNLANAFFLR
jgi:hypothetical protein